MRAGSYTVSRPRPDFIVRLTQDFPDLSHIRAGWLSAFLRVKSNQKSIGRLRFGHRFVAHRGQMDDPDIRRPLVGEGRGELVFDIRDALGADRGSGSVLLFELYGEDERTGLHRDGSPGGIASVSTRDAAGDLNVTIRPSDSGLVVAVATASVKDLKRCVSQGDWNSIRGRYRGGFRCADWYT